jgi:predicted PurR-regulated permease PerM
VPVVLFYLLRDWNQLIASIGSLVPPRAAAKVGTLAREIDAVLAEWLRGQVLVILIMSVYYVLALWLAGLQFALPIGIITGLAVIVPYVGVIVGLALATIAALLQSEGGLSGLLWVWLAIGIGQALEGMAVTPLIVGERIGLHPVVVIFALLAFGHVFGFFGVLLALPASAALFVGLRHLRAAYLAGPLYQEK